MFNSKGLLGVLQQNAKTSAIRDAARKRALAEEDKLDNAPTPPAPGADAQQGGGGVDFNYRTIPNPDLYPDGNVPADDSKKEEEQVFSKGGCARKLAVKLAGGGEARAQAREFWKNAPQNPVPTPGRANPANPADMMKARLQKSQTAQMKPIPTQTVSPVKASIGKLATFLPNTSGAVPMGVQAASQVLEQPIVRDQINQGISTAKDKAGIAQEKTPFNFSKGGSVGYGKGVQCLREGGPVIGPGTETSDSISAQLPEGTFIIPADAVKVIGYEKLLELKDAAEAESQDEESAESPQDERAEEIPAKISNGEFEFTPEEVEFFGGPEFFEKLVMDATGHGTQPEIENGEVHAAYGANIKDDLEAQARINKMLGIKPNIVSTQTPDLTATPGKNGVVANPKLANIPDPTIQEKINTNIGIDRAKTTRPMSKEAIAFDAERAARPMVEPTNAKPVNAGSWKKPIVEAGGKLSQLLAGASGAIPTQAAGQVLDQPIVRNQINQGISTAKEKAGIDQEKTPFNANLAKFLTKDVTSYNSTPPVKPALNETPVSQQQQSAVTETPVSQQQVITETPVAQPQQAASYTGGWSKPADIANWQESGRRNASEGVIQTLPWGHDRFTNSGDTEKDAALTNALEAEAQMRMQKELSDPATRDTYEEGPNGGYSRTTERGGYNAQLPESNNLGVAALRQKQENSDRDYGLKAKALSAKLSGNNAGKGDNIPPENVEDVQAALSNFDSENEAAKMKSRQFLYKWFPELYNSTLKQSLEQGG